MGVSEKDLSMLRLIDAEFQRDVLDKLVRLETKMDTLVGAEQPGRMKIAEDKIATLERNLAEANSELARQEAELQRCRRRRAASADGGRR